MPRATTSPTAGVSPLQSSTPSVEEIAPVQPPSDAIPASAAAAAASAATPATAATPAAVRKPPTALNLTESRRGRRKKSVMSMPRVLPSPTVPLLHRIPGSINFPRLAGSPTPPSLSSSSASSSSSSSDDDDDARSSPPRSASRRSFPADWDATARRRLLGHSSGESTLPERSPPENFRPFPPISD